MDLVLDRGGALYVVRPRAHHRLAARIHADRIDRSLAAGVEPEASVQTSLRARVLTSPLMRRRCASGIERLIDSASSAGEAPSLLVTRTAVRGALSELIELHRLLRDDPLPRVCGMARTHLLLTDGTGPLYNRRSESDLRYVVGAALAGFTR